MPGRKLWAELAYWKSTGADLAQSEHTERMIAAATEPMIAAHAAQLEEAAGAAATEARPNRRLY